MIFNDQETAQEFRQETEIQLQEFICNIVREVKKYPADFSDDVISNYVKMEMRKLPGNVAILLYRSGIIYPADSSGVYPVNLYYDDDNNNQYMVGQAVKNCGRISGGIVDGRIHT